MMKQLKTCLFWKSLKQLFIISLISCFILLGSSFVNAELSILDYWSVWNLSSVSSEWNFNYDWNNFYNATSSTSSYSRIWWESDSFLHFNKRNYNSSSYLKWKITWFFVCPLMTWLWNTYLKNIDWCEYYFWFGSDFMNLIKNTDKWAYFYNSNSSNNRTVLCWVNSLSNEMICVDYSYYDNEWSWKMSDSDILVVSVQNPNKWDSWWNWNLEPDSDKVYYSDNNQIYYDTFKAIWFSENLCYSNFELNNVVNINTAYYDLFPSPSAWSGASIFELYNNWNLSSLNPFNAYYSWYSSRYNRLNNSSDKWTMFINSLYSGVSIWNYYIFDKLYNNEFIESYDLSYKDYYCFCDMAINWFDSDEMNHCDLSISFDNIMTSSPWIRNGTDIWEDWNFILSWADEFWYFSWSAWIFDVFNRLYSQFKYAFRVDSSLSSNTKWILPTYIIFGFFLFVLLYVLKR